MSERQALDLIEARLVHDEPALAALFRLGLPEPDRSLSAWLRRHALGVCLAGSVVVVTLATLLLCGPAAAAVVGCLVASTAGAVVSAVVLQQHEPFLAHPPLW